MSLRTCCWDLLQNEQCCTGPSEFRVGVPGRFQNAMTLVPLATSNDTEFSGERKRVRCNELLGPGDLRHGQHAEVA
jgi:hypothetical protein